MPDPCNEEYRGVPRRCTQPSGHPGPHRAQLVEGDMVVALSWEQGDAREPRREPEVCKWTQDFTSGCWGTDCGTDFEFTTDGPEENGLMFCPFCGRKLEPVPYNDEREEEE
jgi:hypothetical protein